MPVRTTSPILGDGILHNLTSLKRYIGSEMLNRQGEQKEVRQDLYRR